MAPEKFLNTTVNQANAPFPETQIFVGKSYDGQVLLSVTTNGESTQTSFITTSSDPTDERPTTYEIDANPDRINNVGDHIDPTNIERGVSYSDIPTYLGNAAIRIDTLKPTEDGTYYAAIAGDSGTAIFKMVQLKAPDSALPSVEGFEFAK